MVKKKILLAIGAMAVAAVLGLIFSQSLTASAGPDLSTDDIRGQVEAQYPGEIKELELDDESKTPVYEVEIAIDGKEYELKIDGNSGEVLKLDEKLAGGAKEQTDTAQFESNEDESIKINEKSSDRTEDETGKLSSENADKEKQTAKAPRNENDEKKQATKQPKQKQSILTKEEAIDIALEQFSGNIEGVDLDDDDDRLIYEIEIESSRGEAEIEIDAYTGKVLLVDIDLEED
ncbi:PepSY domain-containing protein [Ralstonia pickettii]|nr:PepSY domain-containing protein [Ralstonia pickettii]